MKTLTALQLLTEIAWERDCAKTQMPKDYVPKTKFSDKDTNSLTRAVTAWLEIHGFQVERVANQGRYIQGKEIQRGFYGVVRTKGKFIKGQGTAGTSDVHSIMPITVNGNKIGLAVKWEIKCKYTKDRVSKEQIKYKDKVEGVGGVVYFITDFDDFVNKFNELMEKYS